MTVSKGERNHMEKVNEEKVKRLIQKVKDGNCNDSFCQLSKTYDSFYYAIVVRYLKTLSKVGLSKNEVEGEKDYVLFKAIKSFDPSHKTKFSTWFCNCTRYYFLNHINSSKKHVCSEQIQIDGDSNKDIVYCYDKNEDTLDYLMSLLGSFKDKRVGDIYKLRYFSGEKKLATWGSIARKLGMSTQTAINLHEKTKVLLKNKVNSKNLCDFV
jgi:hypothetical protein